MIYVLPLLVVALLVSFVIGYRLARPHSRQLAQQQAHINRRVGVVPPPQQAATAGAAAAGGPGQVESFAKYAWPLLFVVAAVAVAVWGGLFRAVPSGWTFANVHKYAWGHGPAILALAAIAAIAIAVYGAGLKSTLFQVLGWTIAVLFVLCGMADWSYRNIINPTAALQQKADVPPTRCPPATSLERRGCDITSDDWSPSVRVENGRDIGMIICHSRGVLSQRTDEGATILYFRVWDKDGIGHLKDRVQYQMYPLGTDCRMKGF